MKHNWENNLILDALLLFHQYIDFIQVSQTHSDNREIFSNKIYCHVHVESDCITSPPSPQGIVSYTALDQVKELMVPEAEREAETKRAETLQSVEINELDLQWLQVCVQCAYTLNLK